MVLEAEQERVVDLDCVLLCLQWAGDHQSAGHGSDLEHCSTNPPATLLPQMVSVCRTLGTLKRALIYSYQVVQPTEPLR